MPFHSESKWHSAELAALVAGGVLPEGRALDLGCGIGSEALFLAAMGWNVLGIDTDEDAIAEAKWRRDSLKREPEGRLRFKVRDLTQFRSGRPAQFSAVVERLVYSNFLPEVVKKRSRREAKKIRRGLLRTAAWALREGGVFVMRLHRDEGAARKRFKLDGSFGRLAGAEAGIPKKDRRIVERYFLPGRLVGTNVAAVQDGNTIGVGDVSFLSVLIWVLHRNDVAFREA